MATQMGRNDDPAVIEKLEDKQAELDRGLEAIMRNRFARNWLLARLSDHCHMELTSHVAGCSDSTAFNEGARSVGCKIVGEMQDAFPNEYVAALRERLTGEQRS